MRIDFSPAEVFIKSVRIWWVVVVLALLGGLLGLLIHVLLPPIYSSRAEITTSINFSQSGILTDEQQDQAINAVGDVILSTNLSQTVKSQALSQGFDIGNGDFESHRFSSRMGYRWIFGYRSKEPVEAAEVTNVWAENSMKVLNDYLLHSFKAKNFDELLSNLESCFEEASVIAPSYFACQSINLREIQSSMNRISAETANEIVEAHGIPFYMSFAWNQKAEQANSPESRNRNLMVFSGLMIGFIVGIFLTQIPLQKPKNLK
jgi:hypothetical protein